MTSTPPVPPPDSQPRLLTLTQLRSLGACSPALAAFERLFGLSTPVTAELCLLHVATFDWGWAAKHLLTPAARADYERIQAPARADYERIHASAWADYERIQAPARADYERIRASARADYERIWAPAWADYKRITAPAWADYERIHASAWADYERITASAFADVYNSNLRWPSQSSLSLPCCYPPRTFSKPKAINAAIQTLID